MLRNQIFLQSDISLITIVSKNFEQTWFQQDDAELYFGRNADSNYLSIVFPNR